MGRRRGGAGAVGRMRSGGRGLLGGRGSTGTRAGSSMTGGRGRGAAGSKSSSSRSGSGGIAGFAKGFRKGWQQAGSPKPETPKKSRPSPTATPKGSSQPSSTRTSSSHNCVKCGGPILDDEHYYPMRGGGRLGPCCSAGLGFEGAKNFPPLAKLPHQEARDDTEGSTMVQHQDDASLQRWGRNLTTIGPAIEEMARDADKKAQLAGAIAASVQKLATQGETDLPAHPTVTAEAAAIAAELKQAQAESEAAVARLRGLAARADALGASYRRNHEVDEARLNGERGSRAREKRADVGLAEQDT